MVNPDPDQSFRFSPADFERIFPFYVTFDAHDMVRQVGRSMRKLSSVVRPGARFSELFVPKRPAEPFDFARLTAHAGRLYTILEGSRGTLLRGQFQAQGNLLVFVGSPWIAETDDLRALGLNLNDFAVHDPTLELLQLVQIQKLVSDDLQKLTGKLSAQTVELEAAARMKDAFLASMSHELRTPLMSIIGLSETLIDQCQGPEHERQRRHLTIVQESGSHLLELINDILDLAKLGSGQHALASEVCAVDELCPIALRRVQAAADQRGQRMTFSNEAAGARIQADPRRMTQVLVNLLDNASKFTAREGALGLRVRAAGAEIRFEVWDQGIGIAEADLPQLFQPFVQIDGRLARRYEGTGLGLALVDKLVTLQRGRIEVKSVRGQGSEFTVIMPRVETSPQPSQSGPATTV